ncbi:hypothetical protein FI667_g5761, partial [Globisporangium splendens]
MSSGITSRSSFSITTDARQQPALYNGAPTRPIATPQGGSIRAGCGYEHAAHWRKRRRLAATAFSHAQSEARQRQDHCIKDVCGPRTLPPGESLLGRGSGDCVRCDADLRAHLAARAAVAVAVASAMAQVDPMGERVQPRRVQFPRARSSDRRDVAVVLAMGRNGGLLGVCVSVGEFAVLGIVGDANR